MRHCEKLKTNRKRGCEPSLLVYTALFQQLVISRVQRVTDRAQLHGLTEYLSQELKVEVTVSPDPVNCVALGTAMSLGLGDKLETGFTDATPRIGRR